MKKGIFFLLAIFSLSVRAASAAGPMLKFVPASKTYTPGQDFEVTLAVDSGTFKTQAVDAWVSFDASKAEIVNIRTASSPAFPFSIMQNIHNDTGKFDISFNSTDMSNFEMVPAAGDLAVVTVRPKGSGTINLTFECSANNFVDSNIFDIDTKDVIDCASNQNGVYTAGGGSDPVNPTATPVSSTPSSGSDPAPTATELPKTGSVENTAVLGVLGVVAIIGSFVLRFL